MHERFENRASVLTLLPSALDCRGYTGGRGSPTPYTRCHRDLYRFSRLIRHAWETVGAFYSSAIRGGDRGWG